MSKVGVIDANGFPTQGDRILSKNIHSNASVATETLEGERRAENMSNKWWRAVADNPELTMEMDEFSEKYFFRDEKHRNRILDKITFVMTVCCIVFLSASIASQDGRAFIPYYFCISYPPLVLIRYLQYSKRKHQYFLLDFCYWANLAVMIYMLFFPENEMFHVIIFAIAHAPLPWTVILMRNSLVFHSVDRFTSCHIHVIPMACLYAIRWYPEDCSRLWLGDFVPGDESDTSLGLFMPAMVLICFFVQQSLELLFINVIAAHPCVKRCIKVHDQEYLTLFRYSVGESKGMMAKVFNLCGEGYRVTMWMVVNMVYTALSSLPVYIYYRFQILNAAFCVLVFVWGTYNGASFYIDVFSRKYENKASTFK